MTGPLGKEGVLQPLTPDPTAPGVLEQQEPPTPPTFAPGVSPGALEQLEQGEGFSPGFLERQQQPPTDQGALTPPPLAPGFLQRQQEQPPADQGAAELPATEGTQPATVEEEPVPVCQEGLEFNENLGF